METKIKITLIANAGLLVTYNNVNIIIDGIFNNDAAGLSNISNEVWNDMLLGNEPFNSIDYILVTHNHHDHFSEEKMTEFLGKNHVKGLFIPKVIIDANPDFARFLDECGIHATFLSTETHMQTFTIAEGIRLQAALGTHIGKEFKNILHFCFLVNFDGRNILFTADTDYFTETYEDFQNIKFDAVFMNPLFFQGVCNKDNIREKIRSDRYCIYHIPFPKDDLFHMRSAVSQSIRKHPDIAEKTSLLDCSLCTIYL